MLDFLTRANAAVNGVVWGTAGIALLLLARIVLTCVNRGFQFAHFGFWLKKTVGAIFRDRRITAHTARESRAISQFQSLCTAMAATIGTGNIVGVLSLSPLIARSTT